MDKILQLNEFFVEGGNQEKSHVLLHITEPSTAEEEAKGYFFAICEIGHADNQYILKIQNIIDEIEQKYYEFNGQGGKHPLEMILEKINQENFSLIENEKYQLDCVVGIISEMKVVFSFHGEPRIMLFYQNKEGTYDKMNLVGNENRDNEDTQFFSQIVEGKISPNDFLFFSSPRVTDYFNYDRLHKLITSRTSKQSAEHLEHALGGLRNDCSYGGLIMHVIETQENLAGRRIRPIHNSGSARSLDHLYVTEQNTANTLAPSVINKFNKKIQSFVRRTPHFIDKIENNSVKEIKRGMPAQIGGTHLRPHHALYTSQNEGIDYRHLIATALRFIWQGTKYTGQALIWIFSILWRVALIIINFITAIFFLLTNLRGKRRVILTEWGQNWKTYKDHFKNLPLLTKILFLISVILAITFVSSIWYVNAKKTGIAEEQKFTDRIKIIKEKTDSAESYLIYNDEAKAFTEIMDVKNILANTDCVAETHQPACAELQKQIDTLALRAKKEVKIDPELIFDWSDITTPLTGLAKINNKIIAYGNGGQNLYVYDMLTKTSKTIATGINTAGFTAKAVPKENDYAIFVYNKNRLLQYDPADDTVKTIEITYPNDNTNITGMVIYNRKLYAIDSGNNQIYKHDNIKSGFSTGKVWIKDSGKIENPIDITIDGDVYVATNSGVIDKYTAGRKIEFNITTIDPPLTQINNIWTYSDLQFIYVLDSVQKRLIIISKDGRLNKQLTGTILQAPIGMSIEETDRLGYILDKNRLFKISL